MEYAAGLISGLVVLWAGYNLRNYLIHHRFKRKIERQGKRAKSANIHESGIASR